MQCEKVDPEGRNVSNRNGWQSIDGIERNPIFIRALREIRRVSEMNSCLS